MQARLASSSQLSLLASPKGWYYGHVVPLWSLSLEEPSRGPDQQC